MREIIEQAGRVLGADDPVTLSARYHLARALQRGDAARDGRWGSESPAQAHAERGRLAPLLPDLERRLPADSPVLLDVRRRLAHDAWLLGDFVTAAPLYLRLYPDLAAMAERGDWLTREMTETRDDLRRALREDRFSDLGGGPSRLFGR